MLRWRAPLVLFLSGWPQLLSQTTGRAIPPVHSPVLSGEMVDLPAALRGRSGVLVLGFSQGSRAEVTAWGRKLYDDYHASSTVIYYEMPSLASVPKFLRGVVLKKVKESVPATEQPRFLPILDHEAEWKSLAGFTSPDDAYILLVDAAGVVQWGTRGVANDASYLEVKRRVDALQSKAR